MRTIIPLLTPLLFMLLATSSLATEDRREPEIVGEIGGDPVYQVLPPDAIPAVRDPKFLRGEAAESQMRPDEPVMGILMEGQARAYSLWQLDAHEIVNDEMRGAAFAPTW